MCGLAVNSILLYTLLFSQFLTRTQAKPQPVFIDISRNTKPAPTATDAAMGLNSIQFMEKLIGVKNSADIRTYTRSAELFSDPNYHLVSEETKVVSKLWNFIRGKFKHAPSAQHYGQEVSTANENNLILPSKPNSKWYANQKMQQNYETVAEYTGQLWFLNKHGIQFREIINVVSVSPDGKSATIECHTEYYNGRIWISCSKIICEFTSHLREGGNSQQETECGVKMLLDCELLVWLPLPRAAERKVREKISSIFESVVIDFFNEKFNMMVRIDGNSTQ